MSLAILTKETTKNKLKKKQKIVLLFLSFVIVIGKKLILFTIKIKNKTNR